MTGNLFQDWPVYLFLGVIVLFFAFVIIKSNLPDKNKKENSGKDK